MKLLIIDDDIGDRLLIKSNIASAGLDFEIIEADSGGDGIEKASRLKPAIIVIDTIMPDMTGFEVCKQIKAIEKGAFKIIVYTGIIDAMDARKARSHGADDYCAKTEDSEPLVEAIKEAVANL